MLPIAIAEEAVIADALKAIWEHVEQEPADEFLRREGHGAMVMVSIVLPAEANVAVLDGQKTVVGDGDTMRVAPDVVEDLLRPGEGWLTIDHPCDRKSSGKEDEHEVLKPFGAIQRVQLPPGKGQPTSRKRALHGVRRRPS